MPNQAQRHDLLAILPISRSNLGRILDELESQGKITQIGDKKSAFYRLKDQ